MRGGAVSRESLLTRTFVELADSLVDDFDMVELLTTLADRCVEVLDAPIAIDEKSEALTLTEPQGRVTFDGVWFRYPAPSSLTIPSLEVVAPTTIVLSTRFVPLNRHCSVTCSGREVSAQRRYRLVLMPTARGGKPFAK